MTVGTEKERGGVSPSSMPFTASGAAGGARAMAASNTWWAMGHAVFLTQACLFVLFPGVTTFYRLAMLGLVASYATDVYRLYASVPASGQVTETLLLSEKTPYFVLVVLLYLLKPATVLLLPLSIYSLFSVLQHARTDKRIYELSWWKTYCLAPSEQILTCHQRALTIASQLEILCAPWLLLSAWSLGLILPLAYVSYLRWQYFVSPRQRAVYATWDQILTRATEHPSCPKSLRRAYVLIRGSLRQWSRVNPAPATARNYSNPSK